MATYQIPDEARDAMLGKTAPAQGNTTYAPETTTFLQEQQEWFKESEQPEFPGSNTKTRIKFLHEERINLAWLTRCAGKAMPGACSRTIKALWTIFRRRLLFIDR